MTFTEWQGQYRTHKERADRVSRSITERAKEACVKAGLSGELLGIHPHNAMVDFERGKPWPDIDYHYVRLSLYLQKRSFYPYRLLDQWNDRAWKRVQRNVA